MKEEIERRLHLLFGEPLSDMYRFAGIQVFEFGLQKPCKNRKGEDITRADQSLHASCHWRITGPEGDILSSEDFGPGTERRDEKAQPFYQRLTDDPLLITAIEADEQGSLHLALSGGHALHLQPCKEPEAEYPERWRYLPKDKRKRHLVVTAEGIEP